MTFIQLRINIMTFIHRRINVMASIQRHINVEYESMNSSEFWYVCFIRKFWISKKNNI